jgi:hypothetical protein
MFYFFGQERLLILLLVQFTNLKDNIKQQTL